MKLVDLVEFLALFWTLCFSLLAIENILIMRKLVNRLGLAKQIKIFTKIDRVEEILKEVDETGKEFLSFYRYHIYGVVYGSMSIISGCLALVAGAKN